MWVMYDSTNLMVNFKNERIKERRECKKIFLIIKREIKIFIKNKVKESWAFTSYTIQQEEVTHTHTETPLFSFSSAYFSFLFAQPFMRFLQWSFPFHWIVQIPRWKYPSIPLISCWFLDVFCDFYGTIRHKPLLGLLAFALLCKLFFWVVAEKPSYPVVWCHTKLEENNYIF